VETGRSDWRDVFKEGDWEGVVAASGADPVVPSVPGVDLPHNLEAREVLLEKVKPGKRVLVVGAGPVGMETADFLIDRGHEVTVVEEAEAPPVSPLTSHGYYLHRRLREHGKLLLGSRVMRVTKSGAIILRGSAEEVLEADSVVWAVGSAPCREPLLVTEEDRRVRRRNCGKEYVPSNTAESRLRGHVNWHEKRIFRAVKPGSWIA
jgi:pyruvate/2-oxoglutarate dehydrogenase complex dihydrolipoamide dehydrogenase (E3) component